MSGGLNFWVTDNVLNAYSELLRNDSNLSIIALTDISRKLQPDFPNYRPSFPGTCKQRWKHEHEGEQDLCYIIITYKGNK